MYTHNDGLGLYLRCFLLIWAYSLDAQTGIESLRPSGYAIANCLYITSEWKIILLALVWDILTWCSWRRRNYCVYMFLWTRKLLKREEIEENCILRFKSGSICWQKKIFWRLSFRSLISIESFCCLLDLKKLGIIPAEK